MNEGAQYRVVTLVLTNREGGILGQLKPFRVATPWFQEVEELVQTVRHRDGLEVTILRLLTVDESSSPAIDVVYLAQVEPLERHPWVPWTQNIEPHHLRMPWAVAGGPDADLSWAAAKLKEAGAGAVISKTQIRSWNLSSIWRLDTQVGTFWLKAVPPFFAHEGAVLRLLDDEPVPELVSHEAHRVLLRHLPGEDRYEASPSEVRQMIETLVDLQWRWRGRVNQLISVGLPEVRGEVLTASIRDVVRRYRHELTQEQQACLARFVATLPTRIAALEACGIPDTLVHGDYHPGNWRGTGKDLAILDRGDCFIGNPLLDVPCLLDRVPVDAAPGLRDHWLDSWGARLPKADLQEAWRLVEPIAAGRLAALYLRFLDQVEPSERVYHRDDPLFWLGKMANLPA
jgi:hypothetical protein